MSAPNDYKKQADTFLRQLPATDWIWLHDHRDDQLRRLTQPHLTFDPSGTPTLPLLRRLGSKGFSSPEVYNALGLDFVVSAIEARFGEEARKRPSRAQVDEFVSFVSQEFGRATAALMFVFVANASPPAPASLMIGRNWRAIAELIKATPTRWDTAPPWPDVSTSTSEAKGGEEADEAQSLAGAGGQVHTLVGSADMDPIHSEPREPPAEGRITPPNASVPDAPSDLVVHIGELGRLTEVLERAGVVAQRVGAAALELAAALERGERPSDIQGFADDYEQYQAHWEDLLKAMQDDSDVSLAGVNTLSAVARWLDARGDRVEAEREAALRRVMVEGWLVRAGRADVIADDATAELIWRLAGAGLEHWEAHRDEVQPLFDLLGPMTLTALLSEDRSALEASLATGEPSPSQAAEAPVPASDDARLKGTAPHGALADLAPVEQGEVGDDLAQVEPGDPVEEELERTTLSASDATVPSDPAGTAAPDRGAEAVSDRGGQAVAPPAEQRSMVQRPPAPQSQEPETPPGDSTELEIRLAATGHLALVGWLRESESGHTNPTTAKVHRRAWHVAALAMASTGTPDDECAALSGMALEELSDEWESIDGDLPRVLSLAALRLNAAVPFSVSLRAAEDLLDLSNWEASHERFTSALAELTRYGQTIHGSPQESRQAQIKRLEVLAAEAEQVIDRAPHQKKVFHRASRVWWRAVEQRSAPDEMTVLARALGAMAGQARDTGSLAMIAEVAGYEDEDVERLIDDLDEQLTAAPQRRQKIEFTAHKQLLAALYEVTELAQRYLACQNQLAVVEAVWAGDNDQRLLDRLREAAKCVDRNLSSPSDALVVALADWVEERFLGEGVALPRSARDVLLTDVLSLEGFRLDASAGLPSSPLALDPAALPSAASFERASAEEGLALDSPVGIDGLVATGRLPEAALMLEVAEEGDADVRQPRLALQQAIDGVARGNHARAVDGRVALDTYVAWVNEDEQRTDRIAASLDSIDLAQPSGSLLECALSVSRAAAQLEQFEAELAELVARGTRELRDRLERVPSAQRREAIGGELDRGHFSKAMAMLVHSQLIGDTELEVARLTELVSEFVSEYMPLMEQIDKAHGGEWPEEAFSESSIEIWDRLTRDLTPLAKPSVQAVRAWINEILTRFGLKLAIDRQTWMDAARHPDWRRLNLEVMPAKFQGIPGLSSVDTHSLPLIVHKPVRRAAQAIVEILEEFDRVPGALVYLGRLTDLERRQIAESARSRPVQMLLIDRTLLEFVVEKDLRPTEALPIALAYSAGQPYTPYARGSIPQVMFYGRRSEIKDLLTGNEDFFVSGGRQLGKSALLKYVLDEFGRDSNHVAAFIDVEGSTASGDDAHRIWAVLAERLGAEIRALQEVHRSTKKDVFDLFKPAVSSWLEADPSRRILILLDEADRFLERQRANPLEISRLRGMADESGHRFRLVFAGVQKVHQFAADENNPIGHFGRPIIIRPLDPESALSLVREPAAAQGIEIDERAAWQVITLTNRHPGLMQLFMKALMDMVFTRKPRRGEPPYVVTEQDVVGLFSRDDGLRSELRRRFELTITLEPRYRAITYAIARTQLEDGHALSVHDLKNRLEHDAPDGFLTQEDHDFTITLEELQDLGVIRMADEGGTTQVRLATPIIRALLGDRARISAKYAEACREDFVEPQAEARRHWRRGEASPAIAQRDLHLLLDPISPNPRSLGQRRSVQWLFGTTALGFEALPGLLARQVGDMRDKKDGERVQVFSPEQVLAGALDGQTQLKALALLAPGTQPRDEIGGAIERLRSWAGDGRRGAILVDGSRPDLWLDVIQAEGDERVILTPWDEPALKAQKRDDRTWLDTRLQRREILDVSGGWPELLQDVLEQDRFIVTRWRELIAAKCMDPSWAAGFLTRIGLREVPAVQGLLRETVMEDPARMREPDWTPEPWAWTDLQALDETGEVLRTLELLGIARRVEESGVPVGLLNGPVMRAIGAVGSAPGR